MSSFTSESIVVPIDFSEASATAIRTALDIAGDPAKVHVLHVLLPLESVSPGSVWGTVNDQTREEAVNEYFERFLQDNQIDGVDVTVRFGNPGLEIVDYARELGADLIVMPSHGYYGMKRLVLGSVTERVLRHAPCSVFVLRRDEGE